MGFWQDLLLESVGPLVTAVIGTLLVGLLASWITRRAQDRRAKHLLRHELISRMTEAASELYFETQRFWRAKARERVSADALTGFRKELDRQYLESRVVGEVLESQLDAYFETDDPKLLWHRTMDCLTVRYFHLVGMDTDKLLEANAGDQHTGLSVEQLRQPKLVLDQYRRSLRSASRAVLQNEPVTLAPP